MLRLEDTTLPDYLRSRLRGDWDICCPIVGKERSGKSHLGMQLCKALDPTFDHTQIAWSVEDAIEIAIGLEPYSCVLVDEAFDGAFNRSAMTKENKKWVKFLGVSGMRNLGIFICFPRWGNLDPYIREFRATHRLRVLRRGLVVYETPHDDVTGTFTQWSPKLALTYRDATYLSFHAEYDARKRAYVASQK